ncbi:RcnB family protein [Klebsiella sp. RHBSTW-00484]|uniref:RcnB family protein n=1 Tax=unclassified Klebsiella TaxID=2608929 RepID=UPI0015E4DF5E|nr:MULTISPECIES: RcnB family protein [unclassified Klebsiella]MBA7845945.1 RcnB family protein [Klebsiella sp. RHBSTW-00465]QLO38122.1 RcnB family protein [Klebsiella sp. RHBSTW-00484]QLT77642.1 RcnB family protein [Klebsiella sp. RHBSTW-00464]
MKKILSLAIILSCAFTSVSWADGPGGNNRGQQQVWQNDSGHGGPDGNHQQGPGKGPQGNNHQGNGGDRGGNHSSDNRHQERHEQDHFAWSGHDFRKGQPAPERFRGNDYRVNDWNDRGLPAPPRGQHWSYIDGNYVLIAAATGIITSILINGALNH